MSDLPAHVLDNPRLGTWVTVADGAVEVHVGKVELGQGIVTALAQIAADALALPVSALRMVPAHTTHGPDEGLTAGSLSVLQAGQALRHVGAAVRALASPSEEGYVDRIAALDPDTDLRTAATAEPVAPAEVGRSTPRIDLRDKVLGRPRYLADLRPDGLLHGRVLRPPSLGARLVELDPAWKATGVGLVRDGSFLGLVGEREVDVDRALEQLARDCTWDEVDMLPDESALVEWLREGPHDEIEVLDEQPPAGSVTASYSKQLLVHGSIAPSAGLAVWDTDQVRVWSHSQGIHPLRLAIAGALGLEPAAVEVEHAENAGCYGHNAADDAAFDAVLLARAVPGRPVLVRWTRPDELTWAPLSPAMTATASATLGDGRVSGWSYDVWSTGHSSRPGFRGTPGLLAASYVENPLPLAAPTDPPLVTGGGTTRNAVPLYDLGARRVVGHRRQTSPFRTSAMRALGAYFNVFAIESFMDELALVAGADPVEFRLAHLTDPRAQHVVAEAARLSRWGSSLPDEVGRGVAFARYKDKGAYCAVVAEVAAESTVRVRRLTVVADIGLVVNPDGARNQLEGGATQAVSWTTKERVRFDRRSVTTSDWERYPILTFSEAPVVDVHLVDSPAPSLGAGEAAQGPTAAAVANAVHDALGVRVRDLPLDTAAIVHAIEATE